MFDRSMNHAWGSPLKEASLTWESKAPNTMESLERLVDQERGVEDVIAKFKDLAASIEADIAYFHTQANQAMAANKLSFIKRDILDNVASLEKACQNQ